MKFAGYGLMGRASLIRTDIDIHCLLFIERLLLRFVWRYEERAVFDVF
jgi:hypothetical protein